MLLVASVQPRYPHRRDDQEEWHGVWTTAAFGLYSGHLDRPVTPIMSHPVILSWPYVGQGDVVNNVKAVQPFGHRIGRVYVPIPDDVPVTSYYPVRLAAG